MINLLHLGDITKIKGANVPLVDIVTGGSPCQDLSCAGKRAGLAGERSGLFMEQIRIIKEMRDESAKQLRMRGSDEPIRPRYMVWENVPGAFSSNKGADFQAVLEETAKVAKGDASIPGFEKWGGRWPSSGAILADGWSIAWRVHDAQFWGVPQRRKRIALVADFGGQTAPEILFERKSLSGNTEQSAAQGQETAGAASDGTREPGAYTLKIRGGVERDCYGKKAGKGPLIQTELSATLGVSQDQTLFCIENHPNDSRCKIKEDGIVQTLSSRMGTGGNNVPMVMEQGTYQKTTGSLCASGYDKLGTQEAANDMYVVQSQLWDGSQIAPTLTANNANGAQRMPDKDNFNAGLSVGIQAVSHGGFMTNADDSGIAHTLEATDYKDPQVIAYGLDRASFNQGQNAQFDFAIDQEKIGTQVAKGPGAVCTSIVRRLTPMECERLQGFPDGWTDIGEWVDSKGKKHKDADSPRYKALGNSIALPFWQWMAVRMAAYLPEGATMASLFSGIGGFELVYARAGVKPIWNSEIESYPEAVTRVHFGNGENDDGDYKKYL